MFFGELLQKLCGPRELKWNEIYIFFKSSAGMRKFLFFFLKKEKND